MGTISIYSAYLADLFKKADEAFSQPGNFVPFGVTPQLMNVGYASDFIDLSEECTSGLDMTYDTVKNISSALPHVYRYLLQEEEMTPARARLDMSKKLASYLMLLACNMHECTIRLHKPSVRIQQKQNLDLVWAKNFTMTIGTKQQVDLLPVCMESLRAPKETEEGFVFEPRAIAAKYKRATGEDLLRYGLSGARNSLF